MNHENYDRLKFQQFQELYFFFRVSSISIPPFISLLSTRLDVSNKSLQLCIANYIESNSPHS